MAALFASLAVRKALDTLSSFLPASLAASSSSSAANRARQEQDLEDTRMLERTMRRIHATLHDAEQHWDIHEESTKLRLKELKELAYDAEDVVEEYEYEVNRCKVETLELSASTADHKRKRQQNLENEDLFNSGMVAVPDELAVKTRKLIERFHEIKYYSDNFTLSDNDGERRIIPHISMLRKTSSLVFAKCILGREGDKNIIMEKLLPRDGDSAANPISVLAIVGMGGVGKTALAQLVYNDSRMRGSFDKHAWVCVSEQFDVINITKGIIQSLKKEECGLPEHSLDILQQILVAEIKGKKVLLVLDDVWSERRDCWELLCLPMNTTEICNIVVTTRSERVARLVQTMPDFYNLNCLSPDDSWTLFKQEAYANQGSGIPSNLVEIGRRIAEKCKGLPLAIKTLGSILRFETNEKKWRDVLDSELWNLEQSHKECLIPRVSKYQIPQESLRAVVTLGNIDIENPEALFLNCKKFRVIQVTEDGFAKVLLDCIGREGDKNIIMEKLLPRDGDSAANPISVLAIVGMGGVGKTALAQLVYNDSRMRGSFDKHAWVCVSEQFDVINITKGIIQSLKKEECGLPEHSLDILQQILVAEIKGKKVLLVLDDVWSERRDCWELLCLPMNTTEICNIVVTTRSERVARLVQTMPDFYNLNCLSPDDSWTLFKQEAYANQGSGIPSNLVEIGRRIAEKCKGLPLAIKTLGSILRFETNEKKWRDVLDSELWNLEQSHKEVLPALELSYKHMPIYLKHCFVSLSLYPKDSPFNVFMCLIPRVSKYQIPQESLRAVVTLGNIDIENPEALFLNCKKFRVIQVTEDGFAKLVGQYIIFQANTISATPMSLGELPSLKYLDIRQMENVERIGREFCTLDPRVKAFHSLSNLFFEDMYRFSEWSGVQEGDFSCLETMFIGSAFELMSLPPVPFVSLRNFTLYNCRNVVTLPASTTLQELLISKCANLSELPALPSLQSLKLLNCPSLATVSQFPSLTVLHVCDPFKEEILQRLEGDKSTEIPLGTRYMSIVPHTKSIKISNSSESLRAVVTLGNIDIENPEALFLNCKKFRVIQVTEDDFAKLVGQYIIFQANTISATPMSLGELPSLKYLDIRQMENVERIGREFCTLDPRVKAFHSLSSLFFEDMYRFSEWSGVQEGDFSCLETMFIGSAFELMSLPPVLFISLRNFTLYNCRNVVTLPASTTLQELLISKCANLSELTALPSLQSLKLLNCPSLATVSQFPSLTVLHVCDPFKEEILQRLVNSHMMLEELHVESDTINSICLDPLKLPSLKNLDVRCPNLKSCNAFAGLTSLKILWIRCSPRLHIPDSLRSQLEELRILDF
ncbi:hypothetical protein OsI_36161 [Oryza sativa Indica Group]|uniref:Uncharacterized protein n=1 Tax=Oryza sativa subsp. indica TaxID=39946 RepID=B8BKK7_ORYSI|nr:hypothetical protein OsI_36161 [Oryza sativa Indica Group]